ncbi:SDR family oxidoreductase [Phenylobacterium sp.]|uniref:SDR family oxidoreductase n=1 Tax=Phenylobacterium sp. TaxID=1871053 RepID=UPI0025DE563D|nr:SDR family oxidoreductase [Phenylobacterium sp.]MCA6285070.1 SDR family oxidoreductase [Phenylobacterium sp.]MCA6288025.1 SDR family oxidoreductase [Phenylobacterium sp.]MCA6311002.1 SDR family oxidoreductase [Phenylobacterium sp.]MCA6324755.1 SDR family oxidoreductase [Phenylobacterium sp.]MCA6337065.1 SDR family oxidoreductase [Phenylobacterium sp.]
MTTGFDDIFSIRGKVALVTGGSRGIGEMIAAGFLAAGAKVYISSRKADVCDATAERLAATYGGTCISLPADLSQMSGIESLAARLAEKEDKLDILVNNAGAAWGAPIESFPEVGWDKVMDTNVKGVFFLTQKLLPLLRKAAADAPARVINIGSIDGLKSAAFDTFSYGASKAAVHHLTRFLAAHLTKEKILCNAIAPGPYPTWMLSTGVGFGGETENADWDRVGRGNPSGRVGTAQDIAGLAIFLSSRAGEYVVGQVIASDGGAVGTS